LKCSKTLKEYWNNNLKCEGGRMKSELKQFKEKARQLTEIWDNEKVIYYPKELMSFDELVNLIIKIEVEE